MQPDEQFTEFFTTRFKIARRWAYALCHDWGDAEEFAQHAFVRIYPNWARVRPCTAESYLRTVVTRLVLDTRRRPRDQPVADPPERPVDADFSAIDLRTPLAEALNQVPARQRTVLVLRFARDLSVEQVASELGCSTGTVKSQTARGLRALRLAFTAS